MIALSTQDVSLAYGTDVILKDISFAVNDGDRVGIIGVNGAGKTSLFRIIAGISEPDSGAVYIQKGHTVGMLEQNPDLRVCFDTNHLLKEANADFVRAVGNKIITLHVSDYDFIDEKHVFPGDGLIDWKALQGELEKVDYNGPFMYELNAKDRDGRRTLEDVRANHIEIMNL